VCVEWHHFPRVGYMMLSTHGAATANLSQESKYIYKSWSRVIEISSEVWKQTLKSSLVLPNTAISLDLLHSLRILKRTLDLHHHHEVYFSPPYARCCRRCKSLEYATRACTLQDFLQD
jgi:hypothetical protein